MLRISYNINDFFTAKKVDHGEDDFQPISQSIYLKSIFNNYTTKRRQNLVCSSKQKDRLK